MKNKKWYQPTAFKFMVFANVFVSLQNISLAVQRHLLNQPQDIFHVVMPCLFMLLLIGIICIQEKRFIWYENQIIQAKILIQEYEKLMQRTMDWVSKSIQEQQNEGEEWKKQ